MKLDDNKEALQMLKHTLGSIENRFREAYNKGYKDGFKDEITQAMQKVADAILNEQTEPQTEDLQDWKDRMWAEAVVTEPQIDCSWRCPDE